ncbi:type III-A CRISPR-associated RAMP protein Csm4 [bacterium]|nr:type III-A CRISPR-associated RAMP protein Csm4 [bacterium]
MTTKMITVYLTPKPGSSTFEPTFSSDTLFGAIATAGALLGYGINDWFDDRKFRISNTFPFQIAKDRTQKKTHYFPIPVIPLYPRTDNWEKFLKIKKIKKLKWTPENEFLEILKSGSLDKFYQERIEWDVEKIKKVSFNTSRMIPRNTVNRLSLEVEEGFYAKTEYFFKDGWGLFFMVRASERILEQVKASIYLLQDRGIGGDISTGRGAFNVKINENPPIDFSQITLQKSVILSLYYPQGRELEYIKSKSSYYTIVPRKGFISVSGVRRVFKRRVVALGAGSVIDTLPENLIGDCPIVAPRDKTCLGYDVIFFGRPFIIPMGGKNE